MWREVRHFLAGEELVHVDLSRVLGGEVAAELDEGEDGDEEECEERDETTQVGCLGEVRRHLLEDVQVSQSLLETHQYYITIWI